MLIGIDDNGKPVGVEDSKKLLENLPNKLWDILGIIPSVRLKKKNGKEIIIIEVEHSNYPRNELLADVFFKAVLIEAWGRGTIKIIDECKKAGLPEPEFKEELGGFAVYFYKDIYTEENLRKIGLNERQIKAVKYVKEKGKITNREYQELNKTSKPTATRDLRKLVDRRRV